MPVVPAWWRGFRMQECGLREGRLHPAVRRIPPAGAAPREPRMSGSFRMEVPEHLNSER
ncbi:hypothetical protein Nmel_003562, partial [Mimus melanotis]